jgi:hypothetical protein
MIIRQLPTDDILRRLPAIMETKQRLRIDVHVHCHDIMIHALGRLRALCMAVDPQNVSPSMAAMIFADAWSIVEQVDLVRHAMAAMPGTDTPSTTAFLEHAAQARLMRTAIDHISQRIPNIANRSGSSEALFGALTFVRCDEEQFETIEAGQDLECEMVVLARGTVPGFEASSPTIDEKAIDSSISNLRLSAAGSSVPLDLACAELTQILKALSTNVRSSIDAEVAEAVAKSSALEHDLRAPAPVIVAASAPFKVMYE